MPCSPVQGACGKLTDLVPSGGLARGALGSLGGQVITAAWASVLELGGIAGNHQLENKASGSPQKLRVVQQGTR